MARAVWEYDKRWRCTIWANGKAKHFYSSKPGRAGQLEAEDKAAAWKESAASEDGKFRIVSKLYLEYQENHVGHGTYVNSEAYINHEMMPVIGNIKISAIRQKHWQEIIDTSAKRGLARKTLMNIRGEMAKFARWARRNDYNIQDPDPIIPDAVPKKEKRAATAEELQTLFRSDETKKHGVVCTEWYIHAFRFIVLTGLRRGELAGIQESDIDGDILTISRSVNRFQEETGGKTANARRQIGLPALATKEIEAQRTQKKEAGIISPWLFCDPDGGRINTNSLFKAWRNNYGPHNGIDLTLHELRHTFISAVRVDMPVELLRKIVGHSAATDTTGIYGHDFDGEKERGAKIVDNVFERFQDAK